MQTTQNISQSLAHVLATYCEKNNIRKDTDVLEAFLPDLTKEQWQKIYIMMFQPEFAKKLMEIKEKYEK